MKSSTEITTKVLAATLLTGFFNLSQVEACEGNRVNHVKEFKYVVEAAGVESALNLPADFAKRDERKKISEPLSPVGRMSMSSLPERKGSSTLIRGLDGKACYVLTSLHLLPNGEGVSAVTNEAYPNLLGKSFAELKNENLDQVVFRIGSKFEKAINGEIVGGGKAFALPKPTDAGPKYVTKYAVEASQDWALVRLNEPVDAKYAKPIKLNREEILDVGRAVGTTGIPTDLNLKNKQDLIRYGSTCKKITKEGKSVTECACEAVTEMSRGEAVVKYSCTTMPGMSGGEIYYVDESGEKVLETLITQYNTREVTEVDGNLIPKPPTSSEAAGPSIAHIAPKIDELMRKYPCK